MKLLHTLASSMYRATVNQQYECVAKSIEFQFHKLRTDKSSTLFIELHRVSSLRQEIINNAQSGIIIIANEDRTINHKLNKRIHDKL